MSHETTLTWLLYQQTKPLHYTIYKEYNYFNVKHTCIKRLQY